MFTPCCLNMLSRADPTGRLFVVSALCLLVPRGAGGRGTFACEPLTLRMCLDMPYNLTRMPNILGHYDQHSAGQAMEAFHPLVNLDCHPGLRSFLCSAFAPTCVDPGLGGAEEVPIPRPCQQTCLQVTAACSNLQQLFDVVWPTHLECQRLRECMFNESSGIRPTQSDTVASSAPQQDHRDLGFWCPREYKVLPGLGYSFLGVPDCSPPCPSMFFLKHEVSFTRSVVAAVAGLCFVCAAFTVLTFLLDYSRFRYPERPIVFYALCYMGLSLAYLVGSTGGEGSAACNAGNRAIGLAPTVMQGLRARPCTVLFMLAYFSAMAGAAWWVILAVTWFLAAGLKWGREAIEQKSLIFHGLAWGLPGLQTVTVLALGKVEGDGLSGVCFVGLHNLLALRYLVLLPLCLYVIAGASLLTAALVSLNCVRQQMRHDGRNQSKLIRFMTRIVLFSLLYLLPQLAALACHFAEHMLRPTWEMAWFHENCNRLHIPCPPKALDSGVKRPQLALFLTKYLMTLAAGMPSVFWVSSCKTLHEWAAFLLGRRRGRFEKSGRRVLEDSHDLYSQALLGPSLGRGARRSRGTSTTQGTSTLASSNALEDGVAGRGRSRQNPHAHKERKASDERRDKSSKRCRPRPAPPGAEKGIAVEEKLKGPRLEHHPSQEACE
uniref:frizzled-3-like n=2 Tax=Myxine glutinosa TaxID=7769 RepID=UPI00358E4B95